MLSLSPVLTEVLSFFAETTDGPSLGTAGEISSAETSPNAQNDKTSKRTKNFSDRMVIIISKIDGSRNRKTMVLGFGGVERRFLVGVVIAGEGREIFPRAPPQPQTPDISFGKIRPGQSAGRILRIDLCDRSRLFEKTGC